MPSEAASWLRYTLRIPVYVLSVAVEGRSLISATPAALREPLWISASLSPTQV